MLPKMKSRKLFGNWQWNFTRTSTRAHLSMSMTPRLGNSSSSLKPMRFSLTIKSGLIITSATAAPIAILPLVLEEVMVMDIVTDMGITMVTDIAELGQLVEVEVLGWLAILRFFLGF